jgi:cytochrome P450
MPIRECPVTDIDLWAGPALRDPYPSWRRLRDMGPVVLLAKYGMYALPRYQEVRHALMDWRTFSSAQGVMLNAQMNEAQAGATLHSDPPVHDVQRAVIAKPLLPAALKKLEPAFRQAAAELTGRLMARKTFDAVTDLAQFLPVSIVSRQVGLPEEGRERMLTWAAAAFDVAGPMNESAQAALSVLREAIDYSYDPGLRERLSPGSWAAGIWEAADAGVIPAEKCPAMTIDYWAPALDTTIAAIASAIWLFGRYPEQWKIVRDNPALVPNAINEVLRMESPTPYFSRVTTKSVDLGGVTIPAAARVLMMYGSANRDELKWRDADSFDIRRAAADHLGFGRGLHACVGQTLARMEMNVLLTELSGQVEYFELGEACWLENNMLRQIKSLEVTLH